MEWGMCSMLELSEQTQRTNIKYHQQPSLSTTQADTIKGNTLLCKQIGHSFIAIVLLYNNISII